jgi:hypothetical protein
MPNLDLYRRAVALLMGALRQPSLAIECRLVMKSVLCWAGQNGALIVIVGIVIGLGIPEFAALARPYLAVAIFVFTFGSFLKFDTASMAGEVVNLKRNLLIVLWTTFGVPLIIYLLIRVTHPGPELAQGLLFWALGPASPACVAFAAVLNLSIPIALLATALGTAAAPFYIPALAELLGRSHVDIDPIATCPKLLLLVGGAFLASIAAKRVAASFIREDPEAMTGIAVLAMSLSGMGSMRGMQAHLIDGLRLAVRGGIGGYAAVLALWQNRGADRRAYQRNSHYHADLGRPRRQDSAARRSVPRHGHDCEIHRPGPDQVAALPRHRIRCRRYGCGGAAASFGKPAGQRIRVNG